MADDKRPRRRPDTKPIPKDKHEGAKKRLEEYRRVYQQSQFRQQLPKDVRPTGIDSSAPFYPWSNSGSSSHREASGSGYPMQRLPSNASHTTARTNKTHRTWRTSCWSIKSGKEEAEPDKKKLDPVLQARKALLRYLVSCSKCGPKKVQCAFAHHSLEDILSSYPQAQDLVVWALRHSTDPPPSGRAENRVPSNLNVGPDNPMDAPGDEQQQQLVNRSRVIDQASNVLDIPGPGNVGYTQQIEVEDDNSGMGQDASHLATSYLFGSNQNYGDTLDLMGIGMIGAQATNSVQDSNRFSGEGRPYNDGRTADLSFQQTHFSANVQAQFHQPPQHSAGGLHRQSQHRQVITSTTDSGTRYHRPSLESPFSAPMVPHSSGFHPYSETTYTPQSDNSLFDSFSDPGYLVQSPTDYSPALAPLAMVSRRNHGMHYQCVLASSTSTRSSTCGRPRNSLQDIRDHIRQEHIDHSPFPGNPLRKVCWTSCQGFYSEATSGDCQVCVNLGMKGRLELMVCGMKNGSFNDMYQEDGEMQMYDSMTNSVVFNPQPAAGGSASGSSWDAGPTFGGYGNVGQGSGSQSLYDSGYAAVPDNGGDSFGTNWGSAMSGGKSGPFVQGSAARRHDPKKSGNRGYSTYSNAKTINDGFGNNGYLGM